MFFRIACSHRLGVISLKSFSGRVIAATNRNIHDLVREGKFRADLYYRLCSDIIEIPPLRHRISENRDELFLILDRIIRRVVPELPEGLIEKIEKQLIKSVGVHYDWPGNIRELEQAVRRICLSGHYQPISLSHRADDVFSKGMSAKRPLESYANQLYAKHGTLEQVAKIMDLDPRTVKKYLR